VKPTDPHLLNIFPAFHENRRCITASTRPHPMSLSWARSIQPILHPNSWRFCLILSCLLICLPNCLFTSGLPTKCVTFFSCLPCVPHVPPIPLFLTWSPNNIQWVQNMKCRTWSAEHEVQNMKCRTWITEHEVQNVKYRAWSAEREVQNMKCRTTEREVQDMKCRTWITEHEVQNMKYRAWSAECEVQNMKCRTWSTEHEVQNVKCRTWSAEHEVQNMKSLVTCRWPRSCHVVPLMPFRTLLKIQILGHSRLNASPVTVLTELLLFH